MIDDKEKQVAKKYAQAFLNIFGHQILRQHLASIYEISEQLKTQKRLLFLLKLSHLDRTVQEKGLSTMLVEQGGLPAIFDRLIALLVTHKRGYLLAEVLTWVYERAKEQFGILTCEMISSHALSDTEQQQIIQFIARRTKRDIMYTYKVDKSLIAGICIRADAYRWEYSIRKQLQSLKQICIR